MCGQDKTSLKILLANSQYIIYPYFLQSVERGSLANPTGPMIEPPGIKQERDKMAPSLGSHDRRDDEHPLNKERTTPK